MMNNKKWLDCDIVDIEEGWIEIKVLINSDFQLSEFGKILGNIYDCARLGAVLYEFFINPTPVERKNLNYYCRVPIFLFFQDKCLNIGSLSIL